MPRKADDREAPESSKNLLQMAKLPLIWVREPEIEFYFDSFFFRFRKTRFCRSYKSYGPDRWARVN